MHFKKIFYILRYRFFLTAGILPYLIGSFLANDFSLKNFLIGLLGVLCVFVGIEDLNEFWDRKYGSDLVFLEQRKQYSFPKIAFFSFSLALCVSLYLSFFENPYIFLFSVLGFLCAYSYLGEPFKLSYRGLGEFLIAFSYGPLVVCGSFFLQEEKITTKIILISLVIGLLYFSLAILNQVIDYWADYLVGKRNFCVRFKREGVLRTYKYLIGIVFIYLLFLSFYFSWHILLFLSLLSLVFLIFSYKNAKKFLFEAKKFLKSIRYLIWVYLIVSGGLIIEGIRM